MTRLITRGGAKRLVEVTVDTDGDAGDRTAAVTATAGHPFWVDDRGKFVDAGSVRSGDHVRTAEGAVARVVGVRAWTERQRVHNLTVDGIHTYYVAVGEEAVLVHNCQVEYGSTDLSRAVMQERLRLGDTGHNFAAARYTDKKGVERIAVRFSTGGVGNHAERKLLREYGGSIKEVYSEFQPCTGSNKCRRLLGEAGIPTSYSWPWTVSAKGGGSQAAKQEAVDKLFRDAEQGIW